MLRSGKARKNDPPIPKDLAPISSKPHKVQRPVDDDPMPELIYSSGEKEPLLESTPLRAAMQQPSGEGERLRRRRRSRGRGGKGEGGGSTRPAGEKPAAEKPAGAERPAGEKPSGEKSGNRRRRSRGRRGGGNGGGNAAPKAE